VVDDRHSSQELRLDRESLEELRRIRRDIPPNRAPDGSRSGPDLLAPSVVVGMFVFFFTNSLAVFVIAAAVAFLALSLVRYLDRISRMAEENNVLLRDLLEERKMPRVRQS
jgi:hypothetical protein